MNKILGLGMISSIPGTILYLFKQPELQIASYILLGTSVLSLSVKAYSVYHHNNDDTIGRENDFDTQILDAPIYRRQTDHAQNRENQNDGNTQLMNEFIRAMQTHRAQNRGNQVLAGLDNDEDTHPMGSSNNTSFAEVELAEPDIDNTRGIG